MSTTVDTATKIRSFQIGVPEEQIELLETVGPLTDPTSHGGTPGDAFHLVLPSLPGYGFSGEPTELRAAFKPLR